MSRKGEQARPAVFVGRRTELSFKTSAVQQTCTATVSGHRPEGGVSVPGSEVAERPRCGAAAPGVRRAALSEPPRYHRAPRAEPRAERHLVAAGGTAASPAPKPRAAHGRPPRAAGGDRALGDESRAVNVRGALGKEKRQGGLGGGLEPSGTSSGSALPLGEVQRGVKGALPRRPPHTGGPTPPCRVTALTRGAAPRAAAPSAVGGLCSVLSLLQERRTK